MNTALASQPLSTSKSSLTSNKPVVCILGLLNRKDLQKEMAATFRQKVSDLEEATFKSFSQQKPNFNDNVHRFQFGFLNLEKNKKAKEFLVDKSGVMNPKFIVYVSELNMVGVFNNLSELENLIEDFSFGEFDELKSLRDMIDVREFEDLLVNENLSILMFAYFTIKHSIMWILALFGGIYFLLKNRIESKARAAFVAASVPVILIVIEVISKMVSEDVI